MHFFRNEKIINAMTKLKPICGSELDQDVELHERLEVALGLYRNLLEAQNKDVSEEDQGDAGEFFAGMIDSLHFLLTHSSSTSSKDEL